MFGLLKIIDGGLIRHNVADPNNILIIDGCLMRFIGDTNTTPPADINAGFAEVIVEILNVYTPAVLSPLNPIRLHTDFNIAMRL